MIEERKFLFFLVFLILFSLFLQGNNNYQGLLSNRSVDPHELSKTNLKTKSNSLEATFHNHIYLNFKVGIKGCQGKPHKHPQPDSHC